MWRQNCRSPLPQNQRPSAGPCGLGSRTPFVIAIPRRTANHPWHLEARDLSAGRSGCHTLCSPTHNRTCSLPPIPGGSGPILQIRGWTLDADRGCSNVAQRLTRYVALTLPLLHAAPSACRLAQMASRLLLRSTARAAMASSFSRTLTASCHRGQASSVLLLQHNQHRPAPLRGFSSISANDLGPKADTEAKEAGKGEQLLHTVALECPRETSPPHRQGHSRASVSHSCRHHRGVVHAPPHLHRLRAMRVRGCRCGRLGPRALQALAQQAPARRDQARRQGAPVSPTSPPTLCHPPTYLPTHPPTHTPIYCLSDREHGCGLKISTTS